MLKRTILDYVNDARLLIAERELNEFSDNAGCLLIRVTGYNRIHEILATLKNSFDEIDLTKMHKVLYCIFFNQFAKDRLCIKDLHAISQFFAGFPGLVPVVGLYHNDMLGEALELIILIE